MTFYYESAFILGFFFELSPRDRRKIELGS